MSVLGLKLGYTVKLGLSPWAQAIFYRISLLSSYYGYSISQPTLQHFLNETKFLKLIDLCWKNADIPLWMRDLSLFIANLSPIVR